MGFYGINYNRTDSNSIEEYAQLLIGKTFSQICEQDNKPILKLKESSNYEEDHENRSRKGGLGELIEERFFHYKSNNDSKPDFDEAGVELKVTPYKVNLNGSLVAKERLIITMIDYMKVVGDQFEASHFWSKAKLILLVYYLYIKDSNRLDYKINYVKLFTPPEQDIKIIKHDFETIQTKIKEGKAHELSEGDTLYLGAATKAETSKNLRKQPYSNLLAKPRAFAFKNSYMTYVLNNYIVSVDNLHEPIIKGEIIDSFEQYVIDKINVYKENTVEELCDKFGVKFDNRPKNLEAILAYKMLGIKGNHAEEFEKANVVVKTIRISSKNKIKESMSFPTFKFKELIEEEWDNSKFRTYLSEVKFFFVIYKFDANQKLRFKGSQFWNIPYNDLNNEVYSVWLNTKQIISDGLKVTQKNGKNSNNFPKASENGVCHVRPHAINAKDTYELPDGKKYPKQCFWLNNTYIMKQLNDEFIK